MTALAMWMALLCPQGDAVSVKLPDPVQEKTECVLLFVRGEAPAAGLEVAALYRRNAHAKLRSTQAVGKTGPDGTLRWVPKEPGVVVLRWEGGEQNVSVRHRGVPSSGLVVAVVAGLVLIGGTIFFFLRMLLQAPPEELVSSDQGPRE